MDETTPRSMYSESSVPDEELDEEPTTPVKDSRESVGEEEAPLMDLSAEPAGIAIQANKEMPDIQVDRQDEQQLVVDKQKETVVDEPHKVSQYVTTPPSNVCWTAMSTTCNQ